MRHLLFNFESPKVIITKIKQHLIKILATNLLIILILDIQDNSFDTPVVISHYSHILFGYINSLKISSDTFDYIVLHQIIKTLNLYLLNLELVVIFSLIISIFIIYIKHLTSQSATKKVFVFLINLPRLTFFKFQITNIKAFIRIP